MSTGDELAGHVDALATERGIRSGCHLVVVDESGPPEWRDLDGEHVASYLYRTTLPASCTGIAAVSSATMRHVPHAEPMRTFAGDARRAPRTDRVRVVAAVTRAGSFGTRVRLADGSEREDLRPGDVGLVPDALRRSLGLPTPPPDSSTCRVFAVGWLSALVRAARAGARLDWGRAVRMHPAVEALALAGENVDVATAGLLLARAHGWPELRGAVIARRWRCAIDADEAARHDEGSFSRRLLSTLPDVDALLADVHRELPPSVSKRVTVVLRRWALIPRVPPLPARTGGGDSGAAA